MSESPYDRIARVYDPWSAGVVEDIEFYVEEAVASGGPVVELACGTGRIAVPIAKAGVPAISLYPCYSRRCCSTFCSYCRVSPVPVT